MDTRLVEVKLKGHISIPEQKGENGIPEFYCKYFRDVSGSVDAEV